MVTLPEEIAKKDPYLSLWLEKQPKWYQSFPWKEGIVDSEVMWNELVRLGNIDFTNKKVLDIGSNLGYNCFRIVKAGAEFVVGIEKNKVYYDSSIIIAEKIEKIAHDKLRFVHQALFTSYKHPVPEGFDMILYMSVHHQFDPEYNILGQIIDELKSKANELIIELILPPRFGQSKTEEQIEQIISGKTLRTYPSRSRGVRRVWYWTKQQNENV